MWDKLSQIEKGLVAVALLGLFGLSVSNVHSFDVFWQLQSGRYMVQTQSFIYHDIFTLAPEASRYEHCWLHDLFLYGAYLLGGYSGISVLKGVVIAATGLALLAAARIRESSWLAILFIFPAAMLMTRGGWLERPQLWTFLCFGLFIWLLERHRRRGDNWLFALVPLMAAWVNLHAGSILAVPILAAYLVGEGGPFFLGRSSLPKGAYRKICILAVLLAGAALLTPYPSELWRTLLHSPNLGVQVDSSGQSTGPITALFNMDWRPTTFARDPFFYYGVGVAALVMVLGWRRLNLKDLLLVWGLAFMGWKLSRHTPFFFLGVAGLLPVYADTAMRPVLQRLSRKPQTFLRLAAQAGAVALVFYFALPVYRTYGLFNTGLRTWHYPIEAAHFVQKHELPGNLYNTYDWGGYLAWTLFPEYRVFWDGRQNSKEMFRLGLEVMSGHPGWERILERFDVNTIVHKACTVDSGQRYPILDRLRESEDWSLVFADESSMVFVRENSVNPSWLAKVRLPKSRIDDTILSEAKLLITTDPGRWAAYREIFRISMKRKQYRWAFWAVQRYLARSPRPDPAAERAYQKLLPLVGK